MYMKETKISPKEIPFREAVLQTMKHEEGFVHHPHPGNVITDEEEIKQAF
ncbi:hypothetical protein PO124_17095 [Bacillus licheniformis]|nr:hypothetical protein [Bacillus licheniformis]